VELVLQVEVFRPVKRAKNQ